MVRNHVYIAYKSLGFCLTTKKDLQPSKDGALINKDGCKIRSHREMVPKPTVPRYVHRSNCHNRIGSISSKNAFDFLINNKCFLFFGSRRLSSQPKSLCAPTDKS